MTTRSPSSLSGSQGSGADAPDVTADNEDGKEIDATIFHQQGTRAENIQMVRSQGLEVDNNNEPAQENIPATGEIPLTINLKPGQL